jgi:hypothetical protein
MSTARREFTQKVQAKLEETFLRIQNPAAVSRLRERLTPSQQRQVDESAEELFAPGTDFALNRAIGVWMLLHGTSQVRAIVEVGAQLNFLTAGDREWLLREICERFETVDDAIGVRELVVDQQERVIYWRGECVEVDWYTYAAPWNVVITVVEAAKSGRGVDHTHFGEVDEKYLAKMVYRLRHEITGFPAELANRFVPAGRGTRRLDVAPANICLFRTREVLEEE